MKGFILFLFVAVFGCGAVLAWTQREWLHAPYGQGARTVSVHSGTSAKALAKLLADAKIVSNEQRLYAHLRWFRKAKTKAGEYEFDGSLTPDQVLDKLVKGEVKLYRFTVAEGLRVDEIARVVGATGLCSGDEFLKLARDPALTKKLGVPGPTLEGYLFPDTYSIPKTIGCPGIAQAMVARFKQAWANANAQRDPAVTLDEREAVTLASIVEKETAQPDERWRVSCVFHNRLKKGMRLDTDPTIIYAILLEHDFHWDGNIHREDIHRPHPYNTYTVKGLPPGPIANPGLASLQAALRPSRCEDLFFVSRNDHTHVFCPTLKCHEQAVRKWQVEFFRHKG